MVPSWPLLVPVLEVVVEEEVVSGIAMWYIDWCLRGVHLRLTICVSALWGVCVLWAVRVEVDP